MQSPVLSYQETNQGIYTLLHIGQHSFCIFRKYECRCVLPLLNSSVEVIGKDHRAPGITALLRVRPSINIFDDNQLIVSRFQMLIHHCCSTLKMFKRFLIGTGSCKRQLGNQSSNLYCYCICNMWHRALQGAFSSLMTTQKDQSQETTPTVNGTATLDLATLTPVNHVL